MNESVILHFEKEIHMDNSFLYLERTTEFCPDENTEYIIMTKHIPDVLLHQDEEKILSFWVGEICLALMRRFQDDSEAKQIVENCFPDFTFNAKTKWYEFAFTYEEQCESFLNKLDDLMKIRDSKLCFIYSDLDRICDEREGLYKFIKELIQFWFIHHERLSNIKGKIFLKEDLYSEKIFGFADASKIMISKLN